MSDVLVAVDGTGAAGPVLRTAALLAQSLGHPLRAVHAGPWSAASPGAGRRSGHQPGAAERPRRPGGARGGDRSGRRPGGHGSARRPRTARHRAHGARHGRPRDSALDRGPAVRPAPAAPDACPVPARWQPAGERGRPPGHRELRGGRDRRGRAARLRAVDGPAVPRRARGRAGVARRVPRRAPRRPRRPADDQPGPLVPALLQAAVTHEADIIALPARRDASARSSSVLHQVLAAADRPVALVPLARVRAVEEQSA